MKIPFPQDSLILSDQPFTPQFLNSLFRKFQDHSEPFVGVLVVHNPPEVLLLFILQGEPYSASFLSGNLVKPVDLSQFFTTLVSLNNPKLSLYRVNPVFFKSLLVFSHKRAATRATSELIDLERLIRELEEEKIEVVVVFRQEEGINIFYLRDGRLLESHYLKPDQISNEGSPVEQLLVYAYTAASRKPLEIMVFRDVHVVPATDMAPASDFLPKGVVEYFLGSKPELVVSNEQGVMKTMRLDKGRITMGRGPQNDLVIEDFGVSREHAALYREDNRFFLEDLRSLNGTFLKGRRIQKEALKEGDRFQIGKHTILFLESQENAAAAVKDPSLFEETTKLKMDIPAEPIPTPPPKQNASLSLKVIEGDESGKIFEMVKDKVLLGRLNADIVISDPAVSRQHASIEREQDGYVFKDLKSRNGSFVNGERTERKVLEKHDCIKIGRTVLEVIFQ